MASLYNPEPYPLTALSKGTEIMEGMLLSQYRNSPILKEYMAAFIAEMDILFAEIEEVYLGRLITNAVGHQLDVIGIILQQHRSIVLPEIWFGFQGAVGVDGMSDEATPLVGGVFKSEDSQGFSVVPLDDVTYKKLLLARAYLTNQQVATYDVAYHAISTLIGRVPKEFILTDIGHREVQLTLATDDTNEREELLIAHLAKFMIPAGIIFTILKV